MTKEEWEADGFTSQEDMLTNMRIYYKTMTLDSQVTVVKWNDVHGYWTKKENIETYAKNHEVEAIL